MKTEHEPEAERLAPAVPAAPGCFPEELEALERRLEASVMGTPPLDQSEPCVWFCACFLAHGS